MKPIRLSGHAKGQLLYRGVTEAEVIETILTAEWHSAELDRREARKNFPFANEWNRKYYQIKQVRPIFVEEDAEIVVITVYSYFFQEAGE
jgi:polyisoprenoid-binding protein YceI